MITSRNKNKLLQDSNVAEWQPCNAPICPTTHFTNAT